MNSNCPKEKLGKTSFHQYFFMCQTNIIVVGSNKKDIFCNPVNCSEEGLDRLKSGNQILTFNANSSVIYFRCARR